MRDQVEASLRRRIPRVFSKYSRELDSLSVFEARCAVLELTGEELSRAEIRSFARPGEPISLDVLTKIVVCILRRNAPDAFSFDAIYEMIDTRRRGYITADDLDSVNSYDKRLRRVINADSSGGRPTHSS